MLFYFKCSSSSHFVYRGRFCFTPVPLLPCIYIVLIYQRLRGQPPNPCPSRKYCLTKGDCSYFIRHVMKCSSGSLVLDLPQAGGFALGCTHGCHSSTRPGKRTHGIILQTRSQSCHHPFAFDCDSGTCFYLLSWFLMFLKYFCWGVLCVHRQDKLLKF